MSQHESGGYLLDLVTFIFLTDEVLGLGGFVSISALWNIIIVIYFRFENEIET